MQVEIIKSTISDNFFYLLYADDGADGVLIDPVDGDAAVARARELGVDVTLVVNTHSHPDHTGGNATCLKATGASLAAHPNARKIVSGVTRSLDDGDQLSVGDTRVRVLFTPGHTADHISLIAGDHLFCGDTIFIGGAGNCRFGGDPHALFATFERLAELPDELLIYPGHDYSVRNLEFCLHLDPDNQAAQAKLAQAKELTRTGALVQANLGEEKSWSPFFRAHDPELQARLEASFPDAWRKSESDSRAETAFVTVRALRNDW